MPLAQLAGDGITAGSGHIQIRYNHVWPEKPGDMQRVVPSQRDLNLVPLVAQYQREHVRGIAVIIGDEDA